MIKKLLFCVFVFVALIFRGEVKAQNPFPYNESFTKSSVLTPDLVLGGQAVLTGDGLIDAASNGYLRLTSAGSDQTGFARSLTYFPSTNGIDVSFEYFIYTPGDEISVGADGISFFLFDADVVNRGVVAPYTDPGFNIGGFGGSLGYAQFNKNDDILNPFFPGLSKGYLGIGIDEWGNFSNGTETRSGGDGGRRESSVALRGSGDGLTNYPFLKKVTTQDGSGVSYDFGNPAGPIHQQEPVPNVYATEFFRIEGRKNGRTGGTGPGGRLLPTDVGYRKIRIIMESRAPDPGYKITVWITVGGKNPTKVDPAMPDQTYRLLKEFPYATNPPASLGFGFGAATGSNINFHEIRNIEAVVPASVPLPPVLRAFTKTTFEAAPDITFSESDFVDNFLDPNGINTLTSIRITSLPTSGVLKYDGTAITTIPQLIAKADISKLTYERPNSNWYGSVSFGWDGRDGATWAGDNVGAGGGTKNVTITVTPVNDQPVGADKTVSTAQDVDYVFTTGDFTLTDAVDAANGGAHVLAGVRIVTNPALGSLTLSGNPIVNGTTVPVADITAGNLKFTPAAGQVGNVYTTFPFQVQDSGGTASGGVEYAAQTTMSIIVAPRPTITLNSPNTNKCVGTTPALLPYNNTTNSPNQYSIVFDGAALGAGFVNITNASLPPSSISIVVPAAAAAGIYNATLTVTNTTSGVSSTGIPITVTLKALPTVAAITGTLTVCEGGSAGGTTQLANVTAGGSWSSSNPAVATVSTSGLVTGVTVGTATITYTTAANGDGCTNSATATITVKAKPTVAAITGTLTVCEGGSAGGTTQLANVTAGGSWSSSNPAVATVSTSGLVTGVTAGTVTITYTTAANADGCTSSATATITVNAKPAVAPTTGTLTVCEGGATTQLANVTAGGSWSSSNPAVATVSASGLVTGLTVGTTTITYTTAANGNGCTNSAAVTVAVNAKPTVSAITGTLTVCAGGSTTQLATITAGGSWSSSNTAVATVNASGLVTGVTAGTATITYTTAANADGCTNSTTAVVTVNAVPTVAAISGASATTVGSTTPFTNSTTGGTWSSDNTAVATVSSSGVVTGVAAGTAVITYTVTSNGCTTSVNKTITINAAPVTNTPPIIADITKSGPKDTPVPFTSADFTDKFSDASPLDKVKIVSLPGTGTLKLNGVNITAGQEIPAADLPKITFVPVTGYTGGPVSFQWNGSDGTDYATTAKNVNITITSNTAPVAVADTYATTRGGTLTVSLPGVLTNDTDVDGNPLNAIKVTDPANGTLTLNANGSFVYIHNGGSSGSDAFTYKVNDGTVDGNTVSVAITITAGNAPPVVSDLTKIGTGFTPITFTPEDFKGKYTDPNSDPLVKIIVTSLPPVGTLKLNGVAVGTGQEIPVASLGNLTFEPPVNWSGTTTFGWNGFDGTVYATNPANVSLTVALAGDPTAKIGLAKSLASVTPAPNATYDVKFIFTAVNYGLNALENVSIKDNLLQAFGGATVTVKSLVGFGNLKVNSAFNGSSDTELLQTSSKLLTSEQARVELVINVKLGLTGGLFQNTATAQGVSSVNGVKVTDVSTNGLKPDPTAINDVSPSEVTPIQLDVQPTYVPQGFSPNGDGQNDKFIIQNALGKHVSLEVYNRWGNRVYKAADYKNDWGGEVTEGFFVGRDIPDGTYYYIIIIEKKDKYAGFITINR